MEKINFTNGTTPALNATNLNKLQDNVEDLIKTETTASDTDTYSCNYVNKFDIIGKTIIMRANESQSVAGTTRTKVTNINSEYLNQFTNGEITYSNGDFTINSDNIHTILVNVQIFFQSSLQSYGYIVKNDSDEINSALTNIKHPITCIVNVKKDDVISLFCYTESSTNIRSDMNTMVQIAVLR